jgi:putative MFS transporter
MTEAPRAAEVRNSFRVLLTPAHRPRLIYLVTLYLLAPWATIGFPLLSGAVLLAKGFAVRESLLFAAVSMFGPTVGNLVVASFIDRIARWITLVGCAALMIAAGLIFAASNTFVLLIATGIAFNLLAAAYLATLAVYGAELFPTSLRASAPAAGWAGGRVVATLVPLALLPLLTASGALAMFTVIAAALAATVALIALAGPPGMTRKPLT